MSLCGRQLRVSLVRACLYAGLPAAEQLEPSQTCVREYEYKCHGVQTLITYAHRHSRDVL